jgi:hypothetical protein
MMQLLSEALLKAEVRVFTIKGNYIGAVVTNGNPFFGTSTFKDHSDEGIDVVSTIL